MITKRFPNLWQFLGCYFHQDWTLDFDSADSAVKSFIDEEPDDFINSVYNELRLFVSIYDAKKLSKIALDLGCYYNVSADGLTMYEWLSDVLRQLERQS